MTNVCVTTWIQRDLGTFPPPPPQKKKIKKFSQFKALRSLLRLISSQTVVQHAVLSVVLYFATEHAHHVDVACQPSAHLVVTQAERASEQESGSV